MFIGNWSVFLFMLAMHPLVAQSLPEFYVSGIVQDQAGFV